MDTTQKLQDLHAQHITSGQCQLSKKTTSIVDSILHSYHDLPTLYSNPGDVAHIKNEPRDLQKQRIGFRERNEALALIQQKKQRQESDAERLRVFEQDVLSGRKRSTIIADLEDVLSERDRARNSMKVVHIIYDSDEGDEQKVDLNALQEHKMSESVRRRVEEKKMGLLNNSTVTSLPIAGQETHKHEDDEPVKETQIRRFEVSPTNQTQSRTTTGRVIRRPVRDGMVSWGAIDHIDGI